MSFIRRFWPQVMLVLLLVFGVVFWTRHNEILDWVATRGYNPPAHIAALAEETAMTPYAKQLFYVNRPAVQDKHEFNKNCTDPSEQVAVLGCFVGNRMGIYIYDVTDERLEGIKQVTAAHEMLHQAYQRLSKKERERVNKLLQDYYDNHASEKLRSKIFSYQHQDKKHLLNEMHSIIGTEVPDLPAELEEYYSRYFTDRSRVVVLYQRYQSEFDNRIARIRELDERLTSLKAEIEADKEELERMEEDLRRRREQLDMYLARGDIARYNAAVPGFNADVIAYRNMVDAINRDVERFNSLLAERNELAVQERELENAIDSSLDTASRR